MIFDFDKFVSIAERVYPGGLYSFEDTMDVFQCYFEAYEMYIGQPHPPIRASQIAHIMQIMPYLYEDSVGGDYMEIDPEEYPAMIEKHFWTKYRNCDYNINHFFSGRIRELRCFEVAY